MMIKRVAKAIQESADGMDLSIGTCEMLACMAVKALREPGNAVLKTDGLHTNCPMCGGHLEGWHAMIDAILSESD